MKKFYDINLLKSYDIREVAFKLGLFENENDFKGFCPIHEKSGEHNPSLMYRKYNNTCRCFKCNKTFDNINLIQAYFDIKDFKESCYKLEEILDDNFSRIEISTIKKVEELEEEESEEKKQERYEKALKNSTSLHNMHTKSYFWIDDYLRSRCINYEKVKPLLEENNLEIRHCYYNSWKVLKKDENLIYEKDNKRLNKEDWDKLRFDEKFDNYIMFHDLKNKIIIRRNIEDFLNNKEIKKEDRYRNVRAAHHSKIDNGQDITIIFESMIDMLSFISNIKDIRKYNYISLNSTNNIDNFISEENMDKTYWIMVDNDEAGDVFVEKLQKSSISSIDCRYMFKNYNDVNDSIRAFKENKKKEHKNEQ